MGTSSHIKLFIVATTASLSFCATAQAEDLKPVDQAELNTMNAENGALAAFEYAFEAGDELTEFSFTSKHGVGANVGEGRRFTRIPRADLEGTREWSSHFPVREGGPNATSCIACHNAPLANGAGDVALNVVVDPAHTGDPTKFLERNTLHLFSLGTPQKLAEEMSMELFVQRSDIVRSACANGTADGELIAKNISFGTLSASRTQMTPCDVTVDTSRIEGIDDDLVVRAFGWKGNHSTIRAFTRGAAHNELGLQAVEMVGDKDGDYDGVTDELTVGDITALSVYMAALERPVTTTELAAINLVDLPENELAQINLGETLFASTGCASCHVPQMQIDEPIFREPSTTPGFYDVQFPSGEAAKDTGLNVAAPIWFDMTRDQPNNRIELADGNTVHLGALKKNADGGAVANWFTDFKRHDMGAELADPADPLGIGAQMWTTRSLAGVGSTGPWLHDGRATTLDEAIQAHGGEAATSRASYAALAAKDREALIAYLENLVIYKHDTGE